MEPEKRTRAKTAGRIYRLASTVPENIRFLIDGHRIKEQEFAQADIVAVWRKAVESAHDATLPGLSIDSAIRLAYDAGHLAALALLAVHGLKPSSGQGHHEIAFHAAAALGGKPLEDLVADSEEIRGLRKGSMYDPTIAGENERKLALSWIVRTIPLIRAALVAADPALEQHLIKPQ
ncbi:MAG TPA: hypothetical protein VFW98_05750 [Gemmatimonadaceae bacterium]|nr:hypothetical protein [Gemmatimonadaceae bacterium]